MGVVGEIRKGVKPKLQPTAGITLAPKISKEQSRLDWNVGADALLRKFRALEDRPGTWSTHRGERIAIHGVSESLLANELRSPGDIAIVEGELLIRCQDSTLKIAQVTPAGKKRMSAADFARGARFESGERFE